MFKVSWSLICSKGIEKVTNDEIIILDCKMTVDDTAEFRQSNLFNLDPMYPGLMISIILFYILKK